MHSFFIRSISVSIKCTLLFGKYVIKALASHCRWSVCVETFCDASTFHATIHCCFRRFPIAISSWMHVVALVSNEIHFLYKIKFLSPNFFCCCWCLLALWNAWIGTAALFFVRSFARKRTTAFGSWRGSWPSATQETNEKLVPNVSNGPWTMHGTNGKPRMQSASIWNVLASVSSRSKKLQLASNGTPQFLPMTNS